MDDFEWLAEELRETPRHLWDRLLLDFCDELLARHRRLESTNPVSPERDGPSFATARQGP